MDAGLLIVRLVVGLTMAAHGAQKLFGWFGGGGLAGTAQTMEGLGFRPGRAQALVAGVGELGAGLLLAIGFLTPAAAAVLIAVMLVAGLGVHRSGGFFAHKGGYEYTLVLGAVALALAFTGPGALSLDRVLGVETSGAAWGATALVAGLVGGTGPLVARRAALRKARA
jgi:putative oxidoreductase